MRHDEDIASRLIALDDVLDDIIELRARRFELGQEEDDLKKGRRQGVGGVAGAVAAGGAVGYGATVAKRGISAGKLGPRGGLSPLKSRQVGSLQGMKNTIAGDYSKSGAKAGVDKMKGLGKQGLEKTKGGWKSLMGKFAKKVV
jgi:hypothetical protein